MRQRPIGWANANNFGYTPVINSRQSEGSNGVSSRARARATIRDNDGRAQGTVPLTRDDYGAGTQTETSMLDVVEAGVQWPGPEVQPEVDSAGA